MKRLTKKDFNICNVCDRGPLGMNWNCDGFPACGEKAAYDRLAAYEDTGLEPEEIIELKSRMEELKKQWNIHIMNIWKKSLIAKMYVTILRAIKQ